ncbi:hypothetical protein AX774_g4662 [Zancudomyces culisetae]|uniref:Uncharacterized protein n=1 Tax=Zancudomyces culisetae TaxID=1213189 RepID=A0A1R1PLN7_ZANCU|nr:hypothetical protein AX774_g4662 [Zancudomyces culisetae]|eukprot:OMH81875.1 hypothetical protein AX774_g4662 [Zancudomyces culisetae]
MKLLAVGSLVGAVVAISHQEQCFLDACNGDPLNSDCVAGCYEVPPPDQVTLAEANQCYMGCVASNSTKSYGACIIKCISTHIVEGTKDTEKKHPKSRSSISSVSVSGSETIAKFTGATIAGSIVMAVLGLI